MIGHLWRKLRREVNALSPAERAIFAIELREAMRDTTKPDRVRDVYGGLSRVVDFEEPSGVGAPR